MDDRVAGSSSVDLKLRKLGKTHEFFILNNCQFRWMDVFSALTVIYGS